MSYYRILLSQVSAKQSTVKKLGYLAVALLAAVLFLSLPVSGIDGSTTSSGGGQWLPSTYQAIGCRLQDRICAEWVVEGGAYWQCCMDPNKVYSNNFSDCPAARRTEL